MKIWITLALAWLVLDVKSQGTDVVFIVDGSGSINSTDFQLQKDGIILALNVSKPASSDTLTVSIDRHSYHVHYSLP